ncbi:MAG: hypothetical protein H7306_02035, partial [Bacteriovorax sp.]|nr:hypothetical protein [Rhizobacter sp.]
MSTEPDRIDAAIQAGDAQGSLPGDVIVGTGGGRSAARAPRPAAAARSFVGRVDKPVMPPATLVCTDVVDSTLLVERLGDERAAQASAAHDRCARDLMVLHPDREVVRTDGFFLFFDAVADAARCAMAHHEALAGLALQARVGLHFGPVSQRETPAPDVARCAARMEVEGLAKPFAAR